MDVNMTTVAPFVLKTYQMVDDPSTNSFIGWGRANNSFVVKEPSDFSQKLLPIYFKHNNFSSFVRQLNTYGFKKVDPDKWEFANESFLRGQVQLLRNIVRRRYSSNYLMQLPKQEDHQYYEDADEKEISIEVTRLRHEQRLLEEELHNIDKKLQATETRPQQMMTFLLKFVEDPELVNEKMFGVMKKKRRLMVSAMDPSSVAAPMDSHSPVMFLQEVGGAKVEANTDSCYPFSLLGV